MKTATYNIRIDPGVKESAEKIYSSLGLKLSDAINVFLHKSIMHYGFPFDVRYQQPNENLLNALYASERLVNEYTNGTRKPAPYNSVRDFLNEILNEEDDSDV
ncbi:MAG: type II toxin-antitoxin system RelB/DinJ family antitoxin [Defluviitaleaceae bacterium]|nr:type II toxin-antitoxin system RelB/DinJ family antitoxin [Defluviitaleaceae bacterium]